MKLRSLYKPGHNIVFRVEREAKYFLVIVWLSTLVSATFGHLDSTVVKIEPMVKNQHGG